MAELLSPPPLAMHLGAYGCGGEAENVIGISGNGIPNDDATT